MTISQAQPERYASRAIKILLGVIVVSVVASIFLYNRMVVARRGSDQLVKTVDQLNVANAKLKNDLYTMIDSRSLITQAERLGYIKESNPHYISFLADGSVREGTKVSLLEQR